MNALTQPTALDQARQSQRVQRNCWRAPDVRRCKKAK